MTNHGVTVIAVQGALALGIRNVHALVLSNNWKTQFNRGVEDKNVHG